MEKQFPDHIDTTLNGFGVTYWADSDHKYLIQYSRTESTPCFEMIRGHRHKIQPSFDPDVLYAKCLLCALSNEHPQAKTTDCPSLSIGLSFEIMNLYSAIKLDEAALENNDLSDLKHYLDGILERS